MHPITERLADALDNGDVKALASCYAPNAVSFGPLNWPQHGAAQIAEANADVYRRLGSPRVAVTDEFANEGGDRAAIRLMRSWRDRSSLETRFLKLEADRVIEEFVGPNTFQQADLELNEWGLAPADTSDDPSPEIVTASTSERTGHPASLAERFVDAFGRGDLDAFCALYDDDFVLYSPIAWGLQGTEPLRPFVEQFHSGFPQLRLALHDQFQSIDGDRVAFRFSMRFANTGEFFGHPPTGRTGVHSEFHTLRVLGGRIIEQVVSDVSYGIPALELTVWNRAYPAVTADPSPVLYQPSR